MKKNKGFTLVEVIVAVALLGVITVPIMSTLVRTAQINAKARNVQKATDLGQNLMEGIREYTMEEVIDQCLRSGNDFKIIYSSIISYEPSEYAYLDGTGDFVGQLQTKANTGSDDTEDTIIGTVDDSKTYTSFGGDKYNFAFSGIKYNKSTFDAIVTFEKYVEPSENENGNQNTSGSDPYCIYNVTITIYRSLSGAHFSKDAKLTEITGAVQNK